jgi:tetratricopeptide (TPR) repeat protein
MPEAAADVFPKHPGPAFHGFRVEETSANQTIDCPFDGLGAARVVFGRLLAALVVLTYSPLWDCEFINFDDNVYITQNPMVLRGLSAEGFRWAWTTSYQANWHPLTWLSLQLDAQLFGYHARSYHVTNILLHLANSLLLFVLLWRLTGSTVRSAVVAALFAVHPLHVESVAWVTERKDVLSAFFGLLALFAYARYAETHSLGRYLAVMLAMALSLLAKPMLVTLPAVLLLLDYWPLQRWQPFSDHRVEAAPQGAPATFGRLVLEKLPLIALAAASSIATVWAQQQGGAVRSLSSVPLQVRLPNALISYAQYLRQMVAPLDFALLYPHPGLRIVPAVVAGAFLAACTALVLWGGRRYPYLPVGRFWYLGTLVPVIGRVQVGDQARADRYTYIPLVGIFLLLVWDLSELATRWQLERPAGVVALVGLAILILLGRTQAYYWHDSIRLWGHTVDVTQDNHAAHYNLATALQEKKRWDQAAHHYQEALRLDPSLTLARIGLGVALERQGRREETIGQYREALRLDPDSALAHSDLAAALEMDGKREEALGHYQEALALDPTNSTARA